MHLFRRKGRSDDAPIDTEARSRQLGIKYKDLALLGQLMAQGADLKQPRHALYFLYFATREAAESGAVDARAAGYSCEGRDPPPNNPGQWALVCERSDAIVDPPGVIAADNLFQAIADRLGAEFDGWEAAATR